MSKSPAPFDQGLFLTHLHKGREFFDQDQLEKAREELEAANLLRPHDEKVLNMLGMTYYKLEMLPQAEEMYVILAASNPEIYALQSNLGLIQLKLNKLAEARDSLNRALDLQPTNSKAHFYMALLYEKEGLWEEALYHFKQANAEKMVAKMQAKMDEQQGQPELVLPYEVIEVIPSEADTEPSLSSIVQEEMNAAAEAASSAEAEITGRMRAQDLAQAMFQIHHEEIVQTAEPPAASETSFVPSSSLPEISLPDDIEHSIETERESETEPAGEEDAVDSMVEKLREQIQVESTWEKTHPALMPEHFVDPESPETGESNVVINSAIDEPFLLSDEIAADISTFLAESRTQENPEEDVFYHEPGLPELTLFNQSMAQKDSIPVQQEEAGESRIPTPEEVENEIPESLSGTDSTPLETPAEPAGDMVVPESSLLNAAEEHVEDLSEEVVLESIDTKGKAEEDEELEVNFAVSEGEDDNQVQQGFLQPSYLTPDFEERNLERTQDMAHSTIPRSDSVDAEQQIDQPAAEESQQPPVVDVAAETPLKEEEEATVEQDDAFSQPETAAPQEEDEDDDEEEAPSVEARVEAEDAAHPANLDQFSKDRLYIQPLVGSDRFLLIDPHLLEIILSDKLVCRTGTISSYTGNLQFSAWDQPEKNIPLITVSGNGILFLADRRKEIFLISLNNEVIFVEPNHLLVAQSGLKIEPQFLEHQGTGTSFSVTKISGRGTLALTCLTKPLTVNVHEGLPANIPAPAVIAWSGRVVSEVLDDADLRKVMMSSDQDSMFLRFRGSGDVVVEQGGLWGDRRTKRP